MNRNQHITLNRERASELVWNETFANRTSPSSLLKYVDELLLPAMPDITYAYQSKLTIVNMSQTQAYTGWRGYVTTAKTRELTRDL